MMNPFKRKAVYRFKESKNTACFVCDHVMKKDRPILFVCHDKEDSYWQFLCGQSDHSDENIKLISLEEVTLIDESVNDLFEMPLGVCAEREKVGANWKPFRNKE